MNAHTHLCAVALAAEVGVCGPDGLCGGAAVHLRVGGAVGYGRTIVVCEKNQTESTEKAQSEDNIVQSQSQSTNVSLTRFAVSTFW